MQALCYWLTLTSVDVTMMTAAEGQVACEEVNREERGV